MTFRFLLLASPRYGERWGRHWLARGTFRYRDFVADKLLDAA